MNSIAFGLLAAGLSIAIIAAVEGSIDTLVTSKPQLHNSASHITILKVRKVDPPADIGAFLSPYAEIKQRFKKQ